MAADREGLPVFLGKILTLRSFLSIAAYIVLVAVVNVLKYPPETKTVVYIAGMHLFLFAIATTLFDAFQAIEKMKYIAISNFISGTTNKILSFLLVFLGFGVIGLTLSFTIGSTILLFTIGIFYLKVVSSIKLGIDRKFWLENLKKGMPFFTVGILQAFDMKIGVVILSKLIGEAAVGIYGASFSLIGKLFIIPDSICMAIFPTFSLLFVNAKKEELNEVFTKFFVYLLIIGLGVAVGTTILSKNIIHLIYGDEYHLSAFVLAVLSWHLPFKFLTMLEGYCLGAIKQQSKVLKVWIVAPIVAVVANVILIPVFEGAGVAFAHLAAQVVAFILTLIFVRRYVSIKIEASGIMKIIASNVILGIAVLALKEINLILAVIVPGLLYIGALIVLGILKAEDWKMFRSAFGREKQRIDESADLKI
jgi:O-antigen/teichoic acid export membrane protein